MRSVNAAPTSESDAAPLATRTKMPALEKLLPLLALLPHAAATSMKIDYLRLANVRTDPITHPDGPSPHVHSFYGATEAAPGTTYETLRAAAGNTGNVEDT